MDVRLVRMLQFEDRRPPAQRRAAQALQQALDPALGHRVHVRGADLGQMRAHPVPVRGDGHAVAGPEGRGDLEPRLAVAVHQVAGPGAVRGAEADVLELDAQQGARGAEQPVHRLLDARRVARQAPHVDLGTQGRQQRGEGPRPFVQAPPDRDPPAPESGAGVGGPQQLHAVERLGRRTDRRGHPGPHEVLGREVDPFHRASRSHVPVRTRQSGIRGGGRTTPDQARRLRRRAEDRVPRCVLVGGRRAPLDGEREAGEVPALEHLLLRSPADAVVDPALRLHLPRPLPPLFEEVPELGVERRRTRVASPCHT